MNCPFCKNQHTVNKRGHYKVGHLKLQRIQRYFCKHCMRSFTERINSLYYRDKKPHLNQALFRLICSGVSQRRAAIILGLNKTTVARKIVKFARFAKVQLGQQRQALNKNFSTIVFDEMETFEHTKCKPVSIALVVVEHKRTILAVNSARMPAKGLLAKIARRRYGYRRDERRTMIEKTFETIKQDLPEVLIIKSDENPRYPAIIKKKLSHATHVPFKGVRGCVVGQGELKATAFDPLFSLNHTCAMFRDNLKTLSRRTWCTMKCPLRFQHLLELYAVHHNQWINGITQPTLLEWLPT